MKSSPGVILSPVHTAGLVCEVSTAIGVPLDPARLRSWHTREGLALGEEGGGWRRYSDFDVLALILMRILAVNGFVPKEIAAALNNVRGGIEGALREAAFPQQAEDLFLVCTPLSSGALQMGAFFQKAAVEQATTIAGLAPATIFNLSSLATRVWPKLAALRSNRSKEFRE